jgi:PAS domain S-box-containing protein
VKPLRFARGGLPAGSAEAAPAEPREDRKIKILLIDDQPANLLALESLLECGEFSIVKASSGAEGLRCLLRQEFALVLLDVLMPAMDGFETAALIRERRQSRDTPIIFITAANSNETHVSRGYALGAVDYIYKPIVPEILKTKVQVFAELHRKTRRLIDNERELRRELDEHGKTALARRESEEKYRELFSRASDAIILLDSPEGAVLDANDAALKLYGYSRKELLRLTARDLEAKDGGPAQGRPGERAGSGRARVGHRAKDGRVFPAEITRCAVVIQGRTMTMTLTRDLTEHERAEEAARFRQREAMQRQMVATVSHELRTPIAAIKASAETLRRSGADAAKDRPRFLEIIENHADRLSEIVENLLIDAEIESGKIEPKPRLVALRPFVDRLVKNIAPLAARASVAIRVDVEEDLDVWMDTEHLARIFHNLIDNAIKYNRRRGSVRVSAGRIDAREARISIRDTGMGIAPDDLPRIFQQFYRAERVRERAITGTGLGLSILKTLVESNGGRIWAESVKGKGSAFHFTVPLAWLSRREPDARRLNAARLTS